MGKKLNTSAELMQKPNEGVPGQPETCPGIWKDRALSRAQHVTPPPPAPRCVVDKVR